MTPAWSSCLPTLPGQLTGFGGHENLDDECLVHMEGRVYDVETGRFLSADPSVQDPISTQGYDRYAYIQNDPVSGSDPNGYHFFQVAAFTIGNLTTGDWLGGYYALNHPQQYGQALGSAAPFFNAIPYCEVWCAALGEAEAGYLESGGNADVALNAGLTSAAEGLVMYGISQYFNGLANAPGANGSLTPWEEVAMAAADGTATGAFSVAGGGRFGDGFLGGFVGSYAGNFIPKDNPVEAVIAAYILGGTASKIGGGNFANGAESAAFAELLGQLMDHSRDGSSLTDNEKAALQAAHPDLDVDKLTIAFDSLVGGYTDGNIMHFPNYMRSCSDFTTCQVADPSGYIGDNLGWLIHEGTHTWQYQNDVSPFWGHIFSRDILTYHDYFPFDQYLSISSPIGLPTEEQADWYKWQYECTHTIEGGCN